MNEPFEGFWNRLKMFVENVEVNDMASEEEKVMILHICNEQTKVKNLVKPVVSGSLTPVKCEVCGERFLTNFEGIENKVLNGDDDWNKLFDNSVCLTKYRCSGC